MSKLAYRQLMRHVSAVRLDSAGRVTLPRELLDGLGFETQVVIIGVRTRIEIWPEAAFQEVFDSEEAQQGLAEEMAAVRL